MFFFEGESTLDANCSFLAVRFIGLFLLAYRTLFSGLGRTTILQVFLQGFLLVKRMLYCGWINMHFFWILVMPIIIVTVQLIPLKH